MTTCPCMHLVVSDEVEHQVAERHALCLQRLHVLQQRVEVVLRKPKAVSSACGC